MNQKSASIFIPLIAVLFLGSSHSSLGFVQPQFGVSSRSATTRFSSTVEAAEFLSLDQTSSSLDDSDTTFVQTPLKYLGPYPALALRFPNLATTAQRARNTSGIALDFVLDTAANTNTINGQVAQELNLNIVGEALPGVGSSGAMSGGLTYCLGDTQLENIIAPSSTHDDDDDDDGLNEPFLFMQNLTASALPVASPASAGLLSLAFLYSFEGGVEFNWGSPTNMRDGLMADPPSVAFYAKKDDTASKAIKDMSRVKIESVPVTQLPSIVLKINGVEIPALLDTGSPVTVLNKEAAKRAGIETITFPAQSEGTGNPFAAVANRVKEAQAMAKATAEGNVLTIAGMEGPVNLLKATETTEIFAPSDDGNNISFGKGHVFVGDIPGLAALNGIGVDAPPAVVLGMDVLRRRPKMVLRAQDNEVYF